LHRKYNFLQSKSIRPGYTTGGILAPQINGRSIYPTNTPGIGYAVAFEATNFCSNTIQWVPFTTCWQGNTINLQGQITLSTLQELAISSASNITIFRIHF
jgi:hypothetical protein